jgi:hemophore-related protein
LPQTLESLPPETWRTPCFGGFGPSVNEHFTCRSSGALGTVFAGAVRSHRGAAAADIAAVAAGVAASLSTYVFTHPDVNGFYTGLQDQPKDQIRDDVQNYFTANPQEQADLENIRQPLVDVRQRCQWTPLLGQSGATP